VDEQATRSTASVHAPESASARGAGRGRKTAVRPRAADLFGLYAGIGDPDFGEEAGVDVRLDVNFVDYAILAIYFVAVLGIGFLARRYIKTSLDYFLSGRSLPAWITGLAFISANLGALEILGMAANGAQFGVYTVHYYWIGAIPAMVFLGIVMMPFYYGSKVRSVPEYLRLRFNKPTHVFNALSFALATVLIAGVNLYALALVLKLLLGWPILLGIVVAAAIVLVYITLGGLSSAIYNEVLQFFIILAALIPLTIVGLIDVGGWDGLKDEIIKMKGNDDLLQSWAGTGSGDNPLEASWIPIVFGLGFVLSFGYWTTNFAEVQRALSAKSLGAARRTPLIGAYPKIFIPFITIIPGLVALVTIKGLGGDDPNLQYNNAIPLLMNEYLPNGMLGLALVGLIAAFMAGVAANVSAFNTVVTYDLWEPYVKSGESDDYYLNFGRIATVVGIVIGIATALIASGYNNIMDYIQLLFSFFNAPLFATFIIGMFWKRMTPWAGFWGLLAGTVGAAIAHYGNSWGWFDLGSDQAAAFWGAIAAFVADAIVSVGVTLVTKPKPIEELDGLVYGMAVTDEKEPASERVWYRRPMTLAFGALGLTTVLSIIFA
jgi:SSS family solute:Na+ symporter